MKKVRPERGVYKHIRVLTVLYRAVTAHAVASHGILYTASTVMGGTIQQCVSAIRIRSACLIVATDRRHERTKCDLHAMIEGAQRILIKT